jgi:hypothetical protein
MPGLWVNEVNGVLSLWRSPLDRVALAEAKALSDRQARCSISEYEDFSQMTVYNYEYYINQPSATNESALAAMLGFMSPSSQGAVGGAAFIQQATYIVANRTFFPFSVPDQCNIFSSGTGGSGSSHFYHFNVGVTGTATETFLNCVGSAYTTGGTYFQWLAFLWSRPHPTSTDTCIMAGTGNCCAIRCTFTDCPTAFNAQAPGCALKQCTIDYESGPNGATAVIIASSQCAILGPGELEQTPPNNMGAPQSCTCISVQGGADHTVIADTHISDWTTGIDFSQSGGSTNTYIRNCEVQSYITALNIEVGSDAPITGVKVTSTLLARANYSADSKNASPVVLIAPGSHGNSSLSDITLIDCTVYNMGNALSPYVLTGQHGLQIIGGTNIKIIGGTYSNNSPAGGAGIAITGACGNVQIIGVNLQPSYYNGTGPSMTQSQLFGLLVTSNPAESSIVLVSGCDMRGYIAALGGAPVSTSEITAGLYIYDCLGYNDQNTPLNDLTIPTSPTNAATCLSPYFGPSIITFTNGSPVTLNVFGQSLSLSFGVVFLPSPYDLFSFPDGTPTGFSWYGK